MDSEQTSPVVGPSAAHRARALIARRPILSAVLLTLAWHVVLFALAGTIAGLRPHWFPDLGVTLVNLGAAAVPVGLIVWLGWFRSARLIWRRPDRSWWLVTPLVLEAVSYSLDGVVGTARQLLSAAVLYTVLGISEEALSRGLVQRVLAVLGPGAGGSRSGPAVRVGPHAQWLLVLTTACRHAVHHRQCSGLRLRLRRVALASPDDLAAGRRARTR
jgi:hypothetical protein